MNLFIFHTAMQNFLRESEKVGKTSNNNPSLIHKKARKTASAASEAENAAQTH